MTFNAEAASTGLALITVVLVEDPAALHEHRDLFDLAETGFTVVGMSTALELYRHLFTHEVDIIVLDSHLPDDDSLSVMRHLRLHSSVDIVALHAGHALNDRFRAIHTNANKVLCKPVGSDRLKATLNDLSRALYRTRYLIAPYAEIVDNRWWHLDANAWCLVAPSDERIALSRSEATVLSVLISESGRVVTHLGLLAALARDTPDVDQRRLEMIIYRLRRKVMKRSGLILPLLTVRGSGYVFSIHRTTEAYSPHI